MSIKVMTAVWAKSSQKGSALLLLLAIADHADDAGKAYPSVDTLAEKIRMTPRNTQFLLRKLEESGEISIEMNAGKRGCNVYRITCMGENISPASGENISPEKISQGVKKSHRGGEKSRQKGVKGISPEPSIEPSIETLSTDLPAPEQKQTTSNGVMFERLCFVLFGHTKTKDGLTDKQRGLLNKETTRLQKLGASPDDLADWYKKKWRAEWPGSNGQSPRVDQVVAGVTAYLQRRNGGGNELDTVSVNGAVHAGGSTRYGVPDLTNG